MGLPITYPYSVFCVPCSVFCDENGEVPSFFHLLGIFMILTSCCIFTLPKSINRPMGRIRDFYSNEEEMKEMAEGETKSSTKSGEGNDVTVVVSNEEDKKEKKEGDESVVVVKEDLNEVSKVESKPDSNEISNLEQKTA